MSVLNQEKLRRLLEVGRSLVAELDLDVVLERVLDVACELTGARYAALGVLDERRERLERFITHGVDEPTRRAIGNLPRGHGVLGTLIRDPKPLRLADVGAHPESWGFPSGHPPMITFLGVPILIRGEAFGNLYLTEKAEGEEFDEEDEEAMLVLADWAAVAVTNAQAHRRVRGRRDELERAVRGLEAMTDVARAVGAETRLDRVLELVVKRGRALVQARALMVLLRDGDETVVAALAGTVEESLLGHSLPEDDPTVAEVLRSMKPVRVSDASRRLHAGLAAEVGATSALYVPLVYQARVLGVLAAFDHATAGAEFDHEDERLLESFAVSAAVALATAQEATAQALRRSIQATERERSRWARELHDETLQELAALSIRLSAARDSDELEDVRRVIDGAVSQASAAAQALRHLITDLRPAALDQLGLQPAIEALVERVNASGPPRVELVTDLGYGSGTTRLAREVENAAYRLVQEALTNVVKHSGADRAWVTLRESDEVVTISVRDEGRGFSSDAQTDGFGLIGMRERVALVGGSVHVRSSEEGGTVVAAELPAQRVDEPRGSPGGIARQA